MGDDSFKMFHFPPPHHAGPYGHPGPHHLGVHNPALLHQQITNNNRAHEWGELGTSAAHASAMRENQIYSLDGLLGDGVESLAFAEEMPTLRAPPNPISYRAPKQETMGTTNTRYQRQEREQVLEALVRTL